MSKIDITFGIPIYNGEKYILDLLNCFQDRDYRYNYEILIVDDGSTDNSYNICKKNTNANIRIFRKKNEGVSSARNCIIDNANGKWLTFVDCDDIINFENYMEAFALLINEKADWLINIEKYKKLYSMKYLIENEYINSPCMKIYNMEIIKKNNIYFDNEYDLGEDLLFNLDYSNFSKKIIYFNKKMYIYNKSNYKSLTNKYRENKFSILMNIYEICCQKTSQKEYQCSFEYIRVKNCISSLKSEIMVNSNSYCELVKFIIKEKKYKGISKVKFTSIKKYIVYYTWYLMPAIFLCLIFKILFKKR